VTVAALAIGAALSHARDGAWEPALASLLEAWRAQRAPEIAELVELVSSRVTKGEPPLRSANRKTTREEVWVAAATSMRPALLERLLEAVPEVRHQAERLRGLLDLPRDPRMAAWALRWIEKPPNNGPHENPFFDGLVAILERTMDPRLLPSLERVTAERSRQAMRWAVPDRSWAGLAAHRDALRTLTVPVLDASARATLDAVRERILAVPESEDPVPLFEAVFADPTDNAARAVLGDLLQQRGDPRGELIALQLARSATGKRKNPRETALERTWAREWRGALAPAIDDVAYERGFPYRGRWRGGAAAEATVGVSAWATIIALDMRGFRIPSLLTSPSMRSLLHPLGLPPATLLELRHAAPLRWESLGLRPGRWADVDESVTPDVIAALPAVKRLVLEKTHVPLHVQIPGLVELLGRWPALEELELPIESEDIEPLLSDPASGHLERLIVHTHWTTLTFDRSAKRLLVNASSAFGVSGIIEQVAPLRRSGLIDTMDFRFTSRSILHEPRVVALLLACGRETGITIMAHGRPL